MKGVEILSRNEIVDQEGRIYTVREKLENSERRNL